MVTVRYWLRRLPSDGCALGCSWRLEGGGPRSGVAEFAITGRGATPGLGEMMGMLGNVGDNAQCHEIEQIFFFPCAPGQGV